jgi:Protein of unknown function (DUF2442)
MSISATAVRFDEHAMWVELSDGRTLGVPLAWFPRLLHATAAQRESVELNRTGLHWEDDETHYRRPRHLRVILLFPNQSLPGWPFC